MKQPIQSPSNQFQITQDLPPKSDLLQPENPAESYVAEEEWLILANCFQLSDREVSVAIRIFEGKTRYQVARELECAPGTIRVYIDRLFDKLQVQDRVGMVLRIARAHALIKRRMRSTAASHRNGVSFVQTESHKSAT